MKLSNIDIAYELKERLDRCEAMLAALSAHESYPCYVAGLNVSMPAHRIREELEQQRAGIVIGMSGLGVEAYK